MGFNFLSSSFSLQRNYKNGGKILVGKSAGRSLDGKFCANRLKEGDHPMGGFERVSGGTGVFHPRVLNTTPTTISPEVKKKPGLRNSQEVRGIQERNSVSKCVGVGKEYHQLRPDVVLPQEWTY